MRHDVAQRAVICFPLIEVLMKVFPSHSGFLLSSCTGVSRLAARMSGRRRMVVRSASAALAMATCASLAGCGVPSVADDAGSPAPVPSPTVTASPSPTPTPSPSPTPSPAPSPTLSPTPTPSPIPTTQAPTSQPPLQPLMQESEPTQEPEPESTPEEETQAGGGAAAPAPVPEPKQETTYYDNCTAVRAAGAAPLYRGEPGYRPGLDRDRDGIACEIK